MELKRAKFYEKRDDGAVKCTLCPQGCVIGVGNRGMCLVRKNIGGELYAAGYGKICSLALDPIEKKPLKMFYPGNLILSAGSYGCNFKCRLCQNYSISQQEPPCRDFSPEQLVELALKTAEQGNIGIAYTYNEPLTGYEFVYDCASLAKKHGLKNVVVTNGFINKTPMEELLPFIDAMNIDLKAFTQGFYKDICYGSLKPVMETIALCQKCCHVEVTTLLIPEYNDSENEVMAIAQWLARISPEIPLHLTRHHPDYRMPEPPSIDRKRLYKLAGIAKNYLCNVYCGNC